MKRSVVNRSIHILRLIWHHPSNRRGRIRALARAIFWQIEKRFRREPKSINYFGFSLRCYPDSNSASNIFYFTERFDPVEMDFMEAYLRPGDRFLDIGANIGTYSLFARSLVRETGWIEAFEPNPIASARLCESVATNGLTNLQVHEAAVGKAPGEVAFLKGMDVVNRVARASDGAHPTRRVSVVRIDDSVDPGCSTPC